MSERGGVSSTSLASLHEAALDEYPHGRPPYALID